MNIESGRAAACVLICFVGMKAAWAQDVPTPEQVEAGSRLYAQNCSVCHGPRMVESGGGFFDLRTFPPGQRSRFFNSVSNGKNSMPPWKSVLSQEQIGALWAYVVLGEKYEGQ